ncbi:MAG: hypothetical protein FWG55_03460 [Candidatus Bathyarchaeota archaeon]|nr:hypothetical protein [Candidatus Termiticorpusculum sp.]
MKCQVCGTEVTMPYTCPYCGGQFCSQHRLPENHTCPQISRARTQRQKTVEEVMTQTGSGYNYSFNFNPQPVRTHRSGVFSPKELKHIGIAALLVIGIGFSIGFYNNIYGGNWSIAMMAVFSVCMMTSFLAHEIAHKITAQKRGLWAEFRLTMWGAILTLVSVILPFKLIAPGAMMIGGTADRRGILKISIAGPITNIIFASVFFALSLALRLTIGQYSFIFAYVGFINAFMAVFNLIPIGVLDGFKIFSVNKKVWAIAFIPSVILAIYGYLLF